MFNKQPQYFLLFILLLSAPFIIHGQPDTSIKPVILVLGDSLSAGYGIRAGQGWVNLLQKRLNDGGYPHHVINASISGETTGGALARLPKILAKHQPEIVIVELGGNDGLRGQPIQNIHNNLAAIIELCKKNNSTAILLGMQIPHNYGRVYTKKFSEIYASLAGQYQLPRTPFFLDGIAINPSLMQDDQIHPTETAQVKLLDNVWPVLSQVIDGQKNNPSSAE